MTCHLSGQLSLSQKIFQNSLLDSTTMNAKLVLAKIGLNVAQMCFCDSLRHCFGFGKSEKVAKNYASKTTHCLQVIDIGHVAND